jgi:hypothetical protein
LLILLLLLLLMMMINFQKTALTVTTNLAYEHSQATLDDLNRFFDSVKLFTVLKQVGVESATYRRPVQ